MKQVTLHYTESAGFSQNDMILAAQPLSDEIKRMHMAAERGYDDLRASINLPVDANYQRHVLHLARSLGKPEVVFVIGIGGSNLGAKAVYEAVRGVVPGQTSGTEMRFADTVDPDSLYALASGLRDAVRRRRNVVLCFITKSGGTTETIANFEYLYSVFQKANKQAHKHVVAITDDGSKLWHLAEQEGFSRIAIPSKVGGRYSVFSAVGLLPLALAGIDVKALLQGAAAMRKRCLDPELLDNPAAVSATWLYLNYRKERQIHDTFLFANDLESLGKWYRQLMGESIGKQNDIHHRTVWRGMTPTVSIGSTDLHSMAQLYLGGPYDKCTTFMTLERFSQQVSVPRMGHYEDLVPHIQGRSFQEIMRAIVDGVKTAFKKGKRPFVEISLPDKSEESLGQLLQLKMMEMMYLGFLLNVNPFDQPNVEAYKIETKAILAKSDRQASPGPGNAASRTAKPSGSAKKKTVKRKPVRVKPAKRKTPNKVVKAKPARRKPVRKKQTKKGTVKKKATIKKAKRRR